MYPMESDFILRYVYSMDSDSKSARPLHENKTITLVQGTRIGVG